MEEERQAVVVIHGIGEQKPMGTLRGFVDTIVSPLWTGNTLAKKAQKLTYFSKPDDLSNLFETRRLTVAAHAGINPKTDFFEYYWAYNLRDTKLQNVWIWISNLLLKWPWNFPSRILWLYLLIWSIILFSTYLIFSGLFSLENLIGLEKNDSILSGVLTLIIFPFVSYLVTHFIGDAARYTDPSPENIAERQKIRSDGITLLRKLHESGKYKKIVVVGHSLGSIIGYDLVKNLWAEYNTKYKREKFEQKELIKFEQAYADVKQTNFTSYAKDQSDLFNEQVQNGNPWKITHFVTMGSPLVYSSLLLANGTEELKDRITQRELPTCPPQSELLDNIPRITYQIEEGKTLRSLHHGAAFAIVQWINVYYKNDFVGGPLKDVLGRGITEHRINLQSGLLSRSIPFLSHTRYWGEPKTIHKDCAESVKILKEVLDFKN